MKKNREIELAHSKVLQNEESAIRVDADFKTKTGSVNASGQAANIIAAGVATAFVVGAAIICKDSGLFEKGNELLEVAEDAFNAFS